MMFVICRRFILLTIILCGISAESGEEECLSLNIGKGVPVAECKAASLCNKTYHFNVVTLPPYYELAFEESVFRQCCGKCMSVIVSTFSSGKWDVSELLKSRPDFIFPVREKPSIVHQYGYTFIPCFRFPGFVYITRVEISALHRAIDTCLNMWPLALICLLMSFIVGFLVWIIETKSNPKDFPRDFPFGWLKGIWWSAVSLFSTGLERNPKSFIARVLSVVWLLIAVLLMGTITSVITATLVKPIPTPTMEGKRVATLANRLYNTYIIMINAGTMQTFNATSELQQYRMMIEALHNRTIDGFLIDKTAMAYLVYQINAGKPDQVTRKFESMDLARTDIKHSDTMNYGVLVKDPKMARYIRDAIMSSWLYFEMNVGYYMLLHETQAHKSKHAETRKLTGVPVFALGHDFIDKGLIYLSVILAFLCALGMLYELHRRDLLCCKCWGSKAT